MKIGFILLLYAFIYIISICEIIKDRNKMKRYYLNELSKKNRVNEELKNQLREQRYWLEHEEIPISEQEYIYIDKLKEIELKIKELRSKQLYGNINLIYNSIEEILNRKELSSTDQSVR